MPIIILNETLAGLDAFFHYTMDYLDAKYHTYPDVFGHLYIPPEMEVELAAWNAYAAGQQAEPGGKDGL